MNRPSSIVGIDIVKINQIKDSIDRFGNRFLRRVFTHDEIEYCLGRKYSAAESFAARFAAKEATVKVLRPDNFWIDWRSIEVRKYPTGWCDILLYGKANSLARKRGITAISVSLSHDGDYATAVVLAELDSQTALTEVPIQ